MDAGILGACHWLLCHTGGIPPTQQPRHTWPDPLKSSEHTRSRKRGSPTLAGGLSLCPCEAVFTAQLGHFSSTAAWRPPPDAPPHPRSCQYWHQRAVKDSEKLGQREAGRPGLPAAVLRGPHGRGARTTRRRNTRSPSPQTHARADEQGSAGGLRGQQADSTMYGMEGVGGPRF